MLLKDRVCLVSGVGPGLGQAAARALAREGARVVLCARTKSYLDDLAAEIDGSLPVPTDITDQSQCQAAVEAAVREFGRLDVLVNNAFVPDVFQPFDRVDLAEWRRMFDVNFWGSMYLTQAAVAPMKDAGRGAVVFVNSMVVRKPVMPQGGYIASKGALLAIARDLAVELGRHQIRVNSIVPGWIAGPNVRMYVEARAAKQQRAPAEVEREIERQIALRRIPTPAECADAIVFLASDLASAVTGQTVDVNGGEVFA